MYVLGISGYYHDSAATVLCDSQIIAAAQEERFSRKKHDARFPAGAVEYCLREAGINLTQLSAIAFYDKPLAKFDRLFETHLAYAPNGLTSFLKAMPTWLKDKLFLKSVLQRELCRLQPGLKVSDLPQLLFAEHHQSHAASAFYPSPFESAAVLCLDGVGEWATTSVWLGEQAKLTPQWEIHFPHSLGMLYSAFTYYCGFKVNSGEYKLMGLAPYGQPKYIQAIFDNLIDLKDDGSFRLNMDYFAYLTDSKMTSRRFDNLFGGPPRQAEGPLTQREMDLAASIQSVTETVVLRLARSIHKEFGNDYLCLAGGVALNCVANGKLLREGPFKDIWIQPAAGDAGGALGAAFIAQHEYFQKPRPRTESGRDRMQGAYLGPSMSNAEIKAQLDRLGARYVQLSDAELLPQTAKILTEGNVVGWFQGRMEFGPRALGNRSILGDPRSRKMQSVMNLKIKYRESFRPFAPAVLESDAAEYFAIDRPSPYMLLVADVREDLRIAMTEPQNSLFGIDKLNVPRSTLPAITHIDYSARLQTVNAQTNPRFHGLISQFKAQTGCAVLVNTSFNVRGEPLVQSVGDAYKCFLRTEMDYLVIENLFMNKKDQAALRENENWRAEFELD